MVKPQHGPGSRPAQTPRENPPRKTWSGLGMRPAPPLPAQVAGGVVKLSDGREVTVRLEAGAVSYSPAIDLNGLPGEDAAALRQALSAAERLSSSTGRPQDVPLLTRDAPGQRPGADPEERRQPQANGRGSRSLSVTPDSYDADNHTVEVVLSTGAAVARYYFTEELEISAEAIDLSRVTGGVCPLLDTHNQYELDAQIGRILSARIEGANLVGVVQFDQTDVGQAVEARVARGELRAISIGYRVTRWQITATDENDNETWRAVAWELLEASLVPVPADPNAVVRSAPGTVQHGTTEEEDNMRRNLPGGAAAAAPASSAAPASQTTVVVEADGATRTELHGAAGGAAAPAAPAEQRTAGVSASRILDMCARSSSLGSEFAAELIRTNDATPFSEQQLLERVNERLLGGTAPRQTIDARAASHDTDDASFRQAMADAVTLRANPNDRLDDDPDRPAAQRIAAARDFRGMTLMELARFHLGRAGIDTRGMGRLDIAGAALGMPVNGLRYAAMTTSDFANALSFATNRRVRAAFAAAPQSFRPWISTGTLPDFKPTQIVGLGDAPALLLVPENGEFKRGAIADSGLTYRLQTYGRVIPISRQAIVNDDKDLFGRIPTMFGRKAADLESDLVYGYLLSNPNMGDGQPLFNTAAGNLAAAGSAITVASVSAGETAMLSQKNDDGAAMPIQPEFLIVGPKQKVAAQAFLTAIAAAKTTDVNPYPGNLQLVVEPRITDKRWFLSASPDAFDTIVLSHLDGQEELYTETRIGFDVDGVETKARLDVGAAAIDRRGLYQDPGA